MLRRVCRACIEAREQAAEGKRAEAEEKRREADERRVAQAEAREQAAEEKRAAAEEKRIEAEERKAAQSMVKKAEQSVSRAKPGSTISIFGFGQPKSSAKSAPKKLASAPRGVPVISDWRQERDGGISGSIFGSPSFDEGEFVSTSPITSDAIGGTLVTTESGSKYFLEDASSAGEEKRDAAAAIAEAKVREAEERKAAQVEAREQAAEEKRAAVEAKKNEAEERKAAQAEAREQAAEEKRAAVEAKKREAEERKAAQAEARELAAEEKRAGADTKKREASANQSVGQAKRGASISLFGIGQPSGSNAGGKKKLANAPRGVPVISNWKQGRDGGIDGRIFGSPAFDEGECEAKLAALP